MFLNRLKKVPNQSLNALSACQLMRLRGGEGGGGGNLEISDR
jgi:hypothetical protein